MDVAGEVLASSNSISSFKLCGRNVSNKWNTTDLLRSGCIHTPAPVLQLGRPTLNTLHRNLHARQWVESPGGVESSASWPWGAPWVSLPAIWRKNWALRSFTRAFLFKKRTLNRAWGCCLECITNTPSRCKTDRREELRHLRLLPRVAPLPGPWGTLGTTVFTGTKASLAETINEHYLSVCSIRWCFPCYVQVYNICSFNITVGYFHTPQQNFIKTKIREAAVVEEVNVIETK